MWETSVPPLILLTRLVRGGHVALLVLVELVPAVVALEADAAAAVDQKVRGRQVGPQDLDALAQKDLRSHQLEVAVAQLVLRVVLSDRRPFHKTRVFFIIILLWKWQVYYL